MLLRSFGEAVQAFMSVSPLLRHTGNRHDRRVRDLDCRGGNYILHDQACAVAVFAVPGGKPRADLLALVGLGPLERLVCEARASDLLAGGDSTLGPGLRRVL